MDLNGDIQFNSDGSIKSGGYVNTWPKRIDAIAKGQRAAFVKEQNDERKFAEAEDEQWLLQNIDDIRESFLLDPADTSKILNDRYLSKSLGVPSLIKEIERDSLKQLTDQARSNLDTKIRFGNLDETYINSISDPTTRKLAIEAKQVQDEQKYGPAALGIKKGFRATARKLTKINPNEGNDSPQTFLVRARLEIEYAKALEDTQDPVAANAKINVMVDEARAGNKKSPFYSETGANNRLVFTNIEKVNEELAERNLMIDKRMKTFGAEVASQAFLLANDTEMDATILSAQSSGKVIYSKGILRVADKFGLKPSEVFNQQQQARNLATGVKHPLLTPSLGTEFFDKQNPVTRRLLQSSNASQINRGLNIGLNNVQNSIRGSMQLAYTSGNIGPTSTGPHLDVKRVDGGRFEPNALDDYVVVNDPEFGKVTLGEIRNRTGNVGDNWDQHAARGSHGIDYGLHSGTEIYTTNGANVISNTPTQHGDYVVIELPNGDQYSFLHGKG